MIKLIAYIATPIVAVSALGAFILTHQTPKPVVATKPVAVQKAVVVPAPAPVPPSYHVGDTQTDGSLTITLDSTTNALPSMAELPAGQQLFEVNITITNTGSTPFTTPDAFTSESSVYTQKGTDTSTGAYYPGYDAACFGGGPFLIAPGQTVSGCVEFMVPTNASVDTYFYNSLKWYL